MLPPLSECCRLGRKRIRVGILAHRHIKTTTENVLEMGTIHVQSSFFKQKKAALKPDYLWFSRGEKEDEICNYSLFVFVFFPSKQSRTQMSVSVAFSCTILCLELPSMKRRFFFPPTANYRWNCKSKKVFPLRRLQSENTNTISRFSDYLPQSFQPHHRSLISGSDVAQLQRCRK